jgi:hypothetical protein
MGESVFKRGPQAASIEVPEIDKPEVLIRALFERLLLRPPTADELEYHVGDLVGGGRTPAAKFLDFIRCDEFYQKVLVLLPPLYQADCAYQLILRREPESDVIRHQLALRLAKSGWGFVAEEMVRCEEYNRRFGSHGTPVLESR